MQRRDHRGETFALLPVSGDEGAAEAHGHRAVDRVGAAEPLVGGEGGGDLGEPIVQGDHDQVWEAHQGFGESSSETCVASATRNRRRHLDSQEIRDDERDRALCESCEK
jgi:hypothetical protein